MTINPEQEKRFAKLFPTSVPLSDDEVVILGNTAGTIKAFLASELQRERERVIRAFKESATIMFREHDIQPCDCLMRYVERKLKL